MTNQKRDNASHDLDITSARRLTSFFLVQLHIEMILRNANAVSLNCYVDSTFISSMKIYRNKDAMFIGNFADMFS